METKKTIIGKRKNEFLSQLELSSSSKRRYREALDSPFMGNFIRMKLQIDSIYELTDLNKLWDLYSEINLHPENVRMHRYYSAPIMKYIRFLNGGQKYGKRIDFGKSREITGKTP